MTVAVVGAGLAGLSAAWELTRAGADAVVLEASAGRLDPAVVRSWGDHPKFLDAVASRVSQTLRRFSSPDAVQVLFTAHSLPERIVAAGDPYPDQLRASASAVAQRVGLADWRFAFQSAGATAEPWLGPEAGAVMTDLAKQGHRAFLIVPIGFLCALAEIAQSTAAARGWL